MGKTTGISWTESTWNPWQGCKKVSPGCRNCYMYREKHRFGQDPTVVIRSKTSTFNSPLKWKEPRMVFTCSWSDFFHKDADPWRDEAWDIIRQTDHTYQILTKRPERILKNLPQNWGDGWPNVWLGVSLESQEYIRRVERLMRIPAIVRFVSVEPILGPIDLTLYLHEMFVDDRPLDWVIVGDESGPNARYAQIEWVEDLYTQCALSGAAFFFKQWNGVELPELFGRSRIEFPHIIERRKNDK